MTMTRVLIWGGLLYYSFADFVQNSCYIVFNYDTFHRDNSLVWFKPAICRARHSRLGVDCSDILHLVCWSSHGRNLLIFSGLYHFLASFFFFFFVFFIFALILLVELKWVKMVMKLSEVMYFGGSKYPDDRFSILLGCSFGWPQMGSICIMVLRLAGDNWAYCWYRHTGSCSSSYIICGHLALGFWLLTTLCASCHRLMLDLRHCRVSFYYALEQIKMAGTMLLDGYSYVCTWVLRLYGLCSTPLH